MNIRVSDGELPVLIDGETKVITICGIRYAFSLFQEFGVGPLDRPIKITRREDGVVTFQSLEDRTGNADCRTAEPDVSHLPNSEGKSNA